MKSSFVRFLIALAFSGCLLFTYIEQKNRFMQLSLEVPKLERELKLLVEENHRMAYEIERFENPKALMELARKPPFRHLKQPSLESLKVIDE